MSIGTQGNSKVYLRSFGRVRSRKLTARKEDLINQLLPKLIINADQEIDPSNIFDSNKKKFALEIGFGAGEHLANIAALHNDIGFIGCEPFVNGVASLLAHIDKMQLNNVRIFNNDARLLLDKLPPSCFDHIYILFPDPWPKARHHKKRLITHDMLDKIARIAKKNAVLRIATDHTNYAEWITQHINQRSDFHTNITTKQPDEWVTTRYQTKAKKAGRLPVFFELIRI